MENKVFSKCGNRCDLCLIYRSNVIKTDRRKEKFPLEPTQEELVQKIDVEKRWTWEDEKLMEAYNCRKNMDEFRKSWNLEK